ncbi:hypothetical protein DBR00_18390 [Pseudomonas sp. HMWF032]|uniref:hypothetical protein n=1 Tax=unclassified Pseudomonas TaxID=196821 RepID=UPI000D34D1D2|nr:MULTISPECIES: hypothetical protein [unclassified Pseudomonas]PTS82083.1 hypothetical protein DBR00_18390 [Pseudomonas sp. HMWF032]PTT80670.1 hypothetical protein DBR41_19030 [Pseudomonas sp. HMWF010]WAC45820.1 hypothetical protein OU997_06565 [Pseudomonas sp. SL4(2022)]
MRGSELDDEQYSTDPRPRPWVRVIASLGVFGFLIGLMIGRMFQPDPLWLERVEVLEQGLELWFNVEPIPHEEHVAGVINLRLKSFGRELQGTLKVNGRQANWRLQRERRDLVLRVVAARPLHSAWRAEQVGSRWRLVVSLREQ